MKNELRQFLAKAKDMGFEPAGRDGKSHIRLRHTHTGRSLSIAGSPSDHRTRLNEISRMRRIAAPQ